jgi:uncharacterized protein YabE (DUF348 family)
MKRLFRLAWALIFVFAACQPRTIPVTILDGEQVISISTVKTIPAEILSAASVTLGPNDRLLFLGTATPLNVALPEAKSYTLVVRRAVTVTVVTPEGTRTLQTSAASVGQALTEAGFALYAADRLDPPAETTITGLLTVKYQPSKEFIVTVDGTQVRMRSAAATVGQALAETGIPLVGLDHAVPSETSPLPADGKIRVVRVVENVTLVQKSLPYTSRLEASPDLELDQQNVLQAGEPGLAVSRVRVRYVEGVEVSRQTESDSVVRPPQDHVVSYGTRVDTHTTTVDGITITYWRALQFYATSYHPSEGGTDIMASGKHLVKGLVSIDYHYIPFGTQMYVPGYGYAEAADTGAISGRWIDLGYRDEDYVPWHQWVTVYFLWPPPAVIPYTIPYPVTWKGYSPPPP